MHRVFKKIRKGVYLKFIGIVYLILISFLIFLIDEGPERILK